LAVLNNLRGKASEIRLSEQKTKFLFGISLDLHYLCSRNHINKEIMEARTKSQRAATPFMKAWNQAKNLDDSQKLRLIALLAESVKPATADTMSTEQMLEGYPYKHHTKAELNAMLDEAEARFEAGLGIPHAEVMREMNEEIERWEQEELEMAEAR